MAASSKYANLPDIDSSRDIYETEDPEPWSERDHNDSSDDEAKRQAAGKRSGEDSSRDQPPASPELVQEHLGDPEDARRHFGKQERKRSRKVVYAYPPSPAQSRSPSPSPREPPAHDRLRNLQREVAVLEAELSEPLRENQAIDANGPDTSEMLRGLVDLRGRLSHLSRDHATRLDRVISAPKAHKEKQKSEDLGKPADPKATTQPEGFKTLTDMDARVAELEKLIGSNAIMIDESTPLPPPLLPQMTKLARQITLLSNNKNVESVSRRLKLLLADLDRLHSINSARRGGGATTKDAAAGGTTTAPGPSPGPSTLPADIAPLLARLSPLLPTIPHLLQRLRTLSTLHISASSFSATLSSLEEDQKRVRAALDDLGKAVEGVESSMSDNVERVKANVQGLEGRINDLTGRLDMLES